MRHPFFRKVNSTPTWEGLLGLAPESILNALDEYTPDHDVVREKTVEDLAYWFAREVGHSSLKQCNAVGVNAPCQWNQGDWHVDGILYTNAQGRIIGEWKWVVWLRAKYRLGNVVLHTLITTRYFGSWSESWWDEDDFLPPIGAGVMEPVLNRPDTIWELDGIIREGSPDHRHLGTPAGCYAHVTEDEVIRGFIRCMWPHSRICRSFGTGVPCSDRCAIFSQKRKGVE